MASIHQLKSGHWRAQIRFNGDRIGKTFPERGLAVNWAANMEPRLRRRHNFGLTALPHLPPRVASAIAECDYTDDEIVAASTPLVAFSGIYFLIRDARVVYVGQSKDVLGRISKHTRLGQKDFDSFSVLPSPPDDLDRLEQLYIDALLPIYNVGVGRYQRRRSAGSATRGAQNPSAAALAELL